MPSKDRMHKYAYIAERYNMMTRLELKNADIAERLWITAKQLARYLEKARKRGMHVEMSVIQRKLKSTAAPALEPESEPTQQQMADYEKEAIRIAKQKALPFQWVYNRLKLYEHPPQKTFEMKNAYYGIGVATRC